MISPVEKYTKEELEDIEAEKHRPMWFKFFYGAWLMSTANMDDDQKGWYMTLLCWSALEGDIPGYLPENEDELKEIAGFNTLASAVSYIIKCGVGIPEGVLNQLTEVRERKWKRVRNKFVTQAKHPGYICNRRLVKALNEAYRNKDQQREAGILSQEAQKEQRRKREEESRLATTVETGLDLDETGVKDNLQKQRGLARPVERAAPRAGERSLGSNFNLSSLSSKLTKDSTNTLELKTGKRGLVLEEATKKEEYIPGELVLTPPEPTKRGKQRRAPETVFDETEFTITALMKQHLFEKYPELDDGDLEWMRYKFCNVYHNTRHSSWSRCFYNFVFNQITKYDYEPGSYKRRKSNGGPNSNVGQKQKPWESAGERNSRLEQQAAEYTRKLRGGGVGDTAVDSPGLTLGPVRDD